MSQSLLHRESFRIRPHEITPTGALSLLALGTYLQEAAGHHAEALGVSMESLQADDRAWVLAHLHIILDGLPEWKDEVTVETWPSGLDRLYATREFVLRANGSPFARATSAWLVFDTDARSPRRPPRTLYDIETPDREPVLSHDWEDLSVPDRADHSRSFEVRYHDLDVNRHVNNVRYLEWALETLPADLLDTHQCTALSLQFDAEATLGDTVRATAQRDTTDETVTIRHALRHAGDDHLLARAHTRWAHSG